MSWITTRPPLQYSDVEQLILDIETSTESIIDGAVLATALKFAYHFGLKKKEISSLRVEDVFVMEFSDFNAIRLFSGQDEVLIPASRSMVSAILNFLSYLQNRYSAGFGPSFALFPGQSGAPYNDTSFSRHLDYFGKKLNIPASLEKIRQTGICKFYDNLKASRKSDPWSALSQTAEFARRGKRHTEAMLEGNIQPWGGASKPVTQAPERISISDLTPRLKNNVNLSETEIVEIISELSSAHIPSLTTLEEFRTELRNAIQTNGDINGPEIIAAFYARLKTLDFCVDPDTGVLISLVERVWDE